MPENLNYTWYKFALHTRILVSLPNIVQGSDIDSDLFSFVTKVDNFRRGKRINELLPTQQQLVGIIHDLYYDDPFEIDNMLNFFTGYYLRSKLGFRYAAVSSYLYNPKPQSFLRNEGILRLSFMINSKYPHIDHPVEGAIQIPPWFCRSKESVWSLSADIIRKLLENISKKDSRFANLFDRQVISNILKNNQMVRSFFTTLPIIEENTIHNLLLLIEDIIHKTIIESSTDRLPFLSMDIGVLDGFLQHTYRRIADVMNSLKGTHSVSTDTIRDRVINFLGSICAQLVVEICLSTIARAEQESQNQARGLYTDELLLVSDDDVKNHNGSFNKLPSPLVQDILRSSMEINDQWSVGIGSIPLVFRQDLANSIIICLMDEKVATGKQSQEFLFNKVIDTLGPLGRVAIETETRNEYVQREIVINVKNAEIEAEKTAIRHYGHTMGHRISPIVAYFDVHDPESETAACARMLDDMKLLLQVYGVKSRDEFFACNTSKGDDRFVNCREPLDLIMLLKNKVALNCTMLVTPKNQNNIKKLQTRYPLFVFNTDKAIIGLSMNDTDNNRKCRLSDPIYIGLLSELITNAVRHGWTNSNDEYIDEHGILKCPVKINVSVIPFLGKQAILFSNYYYNSLGDSPQPFFHFNWAMWPDDIERRNSGPGMAMSIFRSLNLGNLYTKIESYPKPERKEPGVLHIALVFEGLNAK